MQGVELGVVGLNDGGQLQVPRRDEAGDVLAGAHRQVRHLQDEPQDRLGQRRLGVAAASDGRHMAGQVALALQGLGHAQRGQDVAQVPGHRLLTGQQHDAQVVDVALEVVDALVGVDHLLGDDDVPLAQGLRGPLDRGGDLVGHGLEVGAQLLELLVEDGAHEAAPVRGEDRWFGPVGEVARWCCSTIPPRPPPRMLSPSTAAPRLRRKRHAHGWGRPVGALRTQLPLRRGSDRHRSPLCRRRSHVPGGGDRGRAVPA